MGKTDPIHDSQHMGDAVPPIAETERTGLSSFDPDKYAPYLADMDMTDDQKAELLRVLWSIMATFVQIGFGDDPVQHVIPALVKAAEMEEDSSGEEDTTEDTTAQAFNCAANNITKGE